MITNPIIKVNSMMLICIVAVLIVLYNPVISKMIKKETTQKKISNWEIANIAIKIGIVFLLFIMNLRIMIPNGETTVMTRDLDVLFVIDTSVSMSALDYDGEKERFEGVINDCCYIVDELSGAQFSIITFGDSAEKLIPFTPDGDMVQAELKALHIVDSYYAKGTSLNMVKDELGKALKDEAQRKESSKIVVFFVSDGEITKEGEKLDSFSEFKSFVADGAVMGYGTTEGGKMLDNLWKDQLDDKGEPYYLYYYDDNINKHTAISKLDETNLEKIAQDMGIDYIHMDKQSNISSKIRKIGSQASSNENTEEKILNYQDVYYYIATLVLILLIADLIIQKRKL